jgi:hypothetical protein
MSEFSALRAPLFETARLPSPPRAAEGTTWHSLGPHAEITITRATSACGEFGIVHRSAGSDEMTTESIVYDLGDSLDDDAIDGTE